MSIAIIYAFACLAVTAANDLLFKFFARSRSPKGMFVSCVGFFWIFTALFSLQGMPVNWSSTILWGVISGFFSCGGNILLLAAMEKLGGGVCSTIYRLNLVPVALGATILLDERLTPLSWCGVILAILAVISFLPRSSGSSEKGGRAAIIAFIMVVCAALMRAGMGLSYSYAFDHEADRGWVVLINALWWLVGGMAYSLFVEKQGINPGRRNILYGAGSGILVAMITLFMSLSLKYGDAAVVLPIAQMSFLATAVAAAILLKEAITIRTIIALLCGSGAVLLLCLGTPAPEKEAPAAENVQLLPGPESALPTPPEQ